MNIDSKQIMCETPQDQKVEDIKYLIEQFAPVLDPSDVISGLSKMFYVTGSFEGDVSLATRIKQICDMYNITIETNDDNEDFSD